MRRIALLVTTAAMLTIAAAGSTAATFPEVIALPNAWLPEGIATGPGGMFYAGSRANGAVYAGSLRTGEGAILVPGVAGRVAVGVDEDRGRLFVAGGPTGDGYVFDADTGATIATFDFTAATSFVNDVIVTRTAAWFTDSASAVLYKVPLGPDGAPGTTFEAVVLNGFTLDAGNNANGIDATPDGKTLIIVQSNLGKLFTVNPETGDVDEIELTGGSGNVVNGDGIHLDGKTLYVVQNRFNQIAVIELENGFGAGAIVGLITNPDFDVPTTIDEHGNKLWAVNARFTTPPTPTTAYTIVQVPKA